MEKQLIIPEVAPFIVPRWNEPIPLTAPDGRVFAYACPQCLHVSANISGGDLELRREESERSTRQCCCCPDCGARHGERGYRRCQPCEAEQQRRVEIERPIWEAQIEARNQAQERAMAACLNRDAATLLLRLMGDISEERYAAGWMHDLEFDLWRMVQGGNRSYGMGEVGGFEISELKRLSDLAGGWWRYDDKNGEMFISLADWEAMVKEAK